MEWLHAGGPAGSLASDLPSDQANHHAFARWYTPMHAEKRFGQTSNYKCNALDHSSRGFDPASSFKLVGHPAAMTVNHTVYHCLTTKKSLRVETRNPEQVSPRKLCVLAALQCNSSKSSSSEKICG